MKILFRNSKLGKVKVSNTKSTITIASLDGISSLTFELDEIDELCQILQKVKSELEKESKC